MWILSFVCGLTFTEFVKGLFINLVSDILYDTGKLAVTFFKGNKEVEEQLKDCFYKAVDKNIKNDQISKYGIVVSDKDGYVESFQEKPSLKEAKSNLANTGIYIFNYEKWNNS